MALETLKDVQEINGVKIKQLDKKPINAISEYIVVRHDNNTLTFKIQNGPILEAGVNGCQIDEIVAVARKIIEGLNENYPDKWNERAIQYLEHTEDCFKQRTKARTFRRVEGRSKK